MRGYVRSTERVASLPSIPREIGCLFVGGGGKALMKSRAHFKTVCIFPDHCESQRLWLLTLFVLAGAAGANGPSLPLA
eukprot:2157595-Amphidinium_carterae.1